MRSRQEVFDAGRRLGKSEANFRELCQEIGQQLFAAKKPTQKIYGMKPWEDAKADAAIALYRAQADATRYSTCTRNLESDVSIVDTILRYKAALDEAGASTIARRFYLDGIMHQDTPY